ncbi:MAG: SseB family protein, partial [Microbacteriaceae bacterium]|nr:SseB family protein [Microbacteriaceae bacterium]
MSLGPDEHGRNTADSAGHPWAGRSFGENTAAADDGSADPALLAALTAFVSGDAQSESVVEAFRQARLLIPLVAHAGDVGHTAEGHLVDKTQELSIVTVAGPDGRKVLPAFTSVAAMSAWDPKARPVPAAGPRVALAAASEQTELVVIDPTGPTEFVLRRPAVYALSTGAQWLPPHRDPAVIAAFDASIDDEPDAAAIRLESGDPRHRLQAPELVVA